MSTPVICWIAAVVVFALAEAATVGLVSIWFVGGAIGALVAAILKASVLVQCIVFVVVSAILIAVLRPLAIKHFRPKQIYKTNADRLLNRQALVTEPIDLLHNTGAVKIDGVTWTARSKSGENIPAETLVRVEYIDGAKVIVVPVCVPETVQQS